MQTQIFCNDPNRFDEVKKTLVKKWVPVLIVAFGVGLHIAMRNEKNSTDILLTAAPFAIIFAFIIVSIRSFSIIKNQKALYESYRLLIDENAISRELTNMPTVRILKIDIIRIDKNKNRGFTIRGKNYGDVIDVAAQIDNYAELESILQQIRPFND